MRTTWTHPDRPGEPFHIFVIDYGCYADLKGTRSEPDQLIFGEFAAASEAVQTPSDSQDIVPLPDRRSIRRIVLSRQDLERFYVK
jgi:hypothetical protein